MFFAFTANGDERRIPFATKVDDECGSKDKRRDASYTLNERRRAAARIAYGRVPAASR